MSHVIFPLTFSLCSACSYVDSRSAVVINYVPGFFCMKTFCLGKVEYYQHVTNSSHQCHRLVYQKASHMLSCLSCDNACKRSPAICPKSRALCPVSRLLSALYQSGTLPFSVALWELPKSAGKSVCISSSFQWLELLKTVICLTVYHVHI